MRILFWMAVLLVVFSTLSPIDWRPESGLPAQVERFGAFLVVSLLWILGFPRHRWTGVVALVGFAALLEVLQTLVPGRHGRLHDAETKALGVAAGAALGMALLFLGRWRDVA